MSKRRYKLTDLAVFALLLCLLEAAASWAFEVFSGEAYILSLALFMTLLMMMRWGAYGLIYAALGGLVYSVLHGGTMINHAVYTFGGLAAAVNLIWLRVPGARRVRDSGFLTVYYCITGYAAFCIGRAAVSAVLTDTGFIPALSRFAATESLNAIITVILIMIARKQNGMFERQEDYLERLKREEQEHGH